MTDSITLLRSEHPLLRKVFTVKDCTKASFTPPTNFTAETAAIESLDSLAELLADIGENPYLAVIRGEPIREEPTSCRVKRNKQNFTPAVRSWCMLDIDDLPCPDDVTDTEGFLATATASLPPEFHNVRFFYRFSSSMGIKQGIRVHLWFWLSRPCSDTEMKAWLSNSPVDPSLFNAIQLHLTCSPKFEDGINDPVKHRAGLYTSEEAADSVTVPEDLMDKVLHNFRTARARSQSHAGTYYPAEIIFDEETGLAIDGREQLMFQLSNECMFELLKAGDNITVERLGQAIWDRFTTLADLTVVGGYKWTIDHAHTKARDRIDQWKSGDFTYKSRSDLTTLLPAPDNTQWPQLVDADTASAMLNETLDGFFGSVVNREVRQVGIRITMGAGKTYQTIEKLKDYLASTFGELIEVYVPRHDLAREWVDQLTDAENTDVVHVRPRTGGREIDGHYDHPIRCRRADYVRNLELAGYPIYRTACHNSDTGERCPYFDDCEYLEQFKVDASPNNVVRIYTHQSLFLPKNPVEDQHPPSMMIIDESFLAAAVGNLPELTTDQILQSFRTNDKPEIGNWIIECLRNHNGTISYLTEDKALTVSDLESIPLSVGAYNTDFARTATAVVGDAHLNANLLKLREVLISELKHSDRDVLQRVSWKENSSRVVLSAAKASRFKRSIPTLYLDATLDEAITATYMPGSEFHWIDVEQRAIVTQVHDRTGSNKAWNGSVEAERKNLAAIEYQADDNDLSKLVVVLNVWANAGEKPLLVGHKPLVDYLRAHPKVHAAVSLAHFQSLRGSNAFKDCSVIFITGRNQPSPEDITVQARAIFGSAAIPFTSDSFDTSGCELAPYWPSKNYQGVPSAVNVRSFSDQRIASYQRQLREAESVQAIARLRLVHSEYRKRIYLLSNIPMEIPVDSLVTFDSLLPNRLEQFLLQHGHVALSVQGHVRQCSADNIKPNTVKQTLKRQGADEPQKLLRFLPALARSSVMLATYKAGDKRKTAQSHLFLPT